MNAQSVLDSIGKMVLHRMSGRYGVVVGLTTTDAKGETFPGGFPRAIVDFASGREIVYCRGLARSVEYDHRPAAIDARDAVMARTDPPKHPRRSVKTQRGERV